MTKRLHVGDFSGFNILVLFVIYLIRKSRKKVQFLITKYVLLYVLAIVLQAGALLVFYISVKLYVDPMAYDVSKIEEYISLHILTKVELLLVTLAPAFLFLLISSKLLKYCRVGLANLALTLKEQLINEHLNKNLFFKHEPLELFFKQIDGTFGAVRALFLNLFVFFQGIVTAIAITFIDPILSLVNVLLLVIFIYILTTFKPTKQDIKDKGTEDVVDIMDEELGLNSKSFERLERLRVFGRNYSNIGLFLFIIVGVLFSLDFMNSLESFSVTLILLRYSMQVYTPIAVISAACVPYKKNIIIIYNCVNFARYWECNINTKSNVLYLCISKDFKKRNDMINIKDEENMKEYFPEYNGKKIKILTALFKDKAPISKKEIKRLIKDKGKVIDGNFLFCV